METACGAGPEEPDAEALPMVLCFGAFNDIIFCVEIMPCVVTLMFVMEFLSHGIDDLIGMSTIGTLLFTFFPIISDNLQIYYSQIEIRKKAWEIKMLEKNEMYKENDLVRIAKRENNTKRNYLVVNRFQGKHVPVEPSKAFAMFEELAELVKQEYPDEKILFIGFAETATAIGAAVSSYFDAVYMQTTREHVPGADYLFFSEEHSHATEQKLVKDDLARISSAVDRVIFIEDEVTTGNTILNIIKILEREYPVIKKYSVASLLNGMTEESLKAYEDREIKLHYLVKTNHGRYSETAERFRGDGQYFVLDNSGDKNINAVYYEIKSYMNARRAVRTVDYKQHVDAMCGCALNRIDLGGKNNILVLGTEEFMYPALRLGQLLENNGKHVKSHATTRSPIAVSSEDEYPLHVRYELQSLYDDSRVTFLYDIGKYDSVIVVTDAEYAGGAGINTLLNAISTNNKEIHIIRWC